MAYARIFLIGTAFFSLPLCARAERVSQDHNAAPVALTGTVESVTEEWGPETDFYKVFVRVTQIERGQAIQPGEILEVSCFQRSRIWGRPTPGASGHRAIPEVGDKIHLYAWPGDSGYEGNYPQWFEVVEPSGRPWIVRLFGYKKVRVAFVIGVSILCFVVWRVRKRANSIAALKHSTGSVTA